MSGQTDPPPCLLTGALWANKYSEPTPLLGVSEASWSSLLGSQAWVMPLLQLAQPTSALRALRSHSSLRLSLVESPRAPFGLKMDFKWLQPGSLSPSWPSIFEKHLCILCAWTQTGQTTPPALSALPRASLLLQVWIRHWSSGSSNSKEHRPSSVNAWESPSSWGFSQGTYLSLPLAVSSRTQINFLTRTCSSTFFYSPNG